MAFPDLLRAEGFDVTLYSPEARRDQRDFDLVLFVMGEETLKVVITMKLISVLKREVLISLLCYVGLNTFICSFI